MNIKDCYNFSDFRKLAKKRLPSPIFIILMVVQMMKLLLKETPMHLMIVI
jgi:hypothetical protein